MIGAAAVSTANLVKRYGRRTALDGMTLAVPRGAIMGLVGANGAGKTTWMLTVAGLLRPTSGTIDLLGAGPFDAAVHGGRLSVLPQDAALPSELSPLALLTSFGRMQGLSSAAAAKSAEELLEVVNLKDRAQSAVRTLSHGMRKRAMVAQCFVGSPELVLLDEPLNGLDPVEASRLRRFIRSRRGRQTIVVSSHQLVDIEQICTHVAFVDKGRTVRVDTLGAITEAEERVIYALTREPTDYAALEAAMPDATFEWSRARCALVCRLDPRAGGVASVNRRLLPVLLAQADVLSVTTGVSLEEALGMDAG